MWKWMYYALLHYAKEINKKIPLVDLVIYFALKTTSNLKL